VVLTPAVLVEVADRLFVVGATVTVEVMFVNVEVPDTWVFVVPGVACDEED